MKRRRRGQQEGLTDNIHDLRKSIIQKYKRLNNIEAESVESFKKQFEPIIDPLQKINKQIHTHLKKQEDVGEEEEEEEELDVEHDLNEFDDDDDVKEEEEEGAVGGEEKEDTLSEKDIDDDDDDELLERAEPRDVKQLLNESIYVSPRVNPIVEMLEKYQHDFHKLNSKSIPYGVKFDNKTQTYYMGDRIPITFSNEFLFIGEKGRWQKVKLTQGLLQLLFKTKINEEMIKTIDFRNYKKILAATGAHLDKRGFVKRYSSLKSNVISRLFPPRKTAASATVGRGILNFVKNLSNQRNYVYWDSPNELVTRLQLLLSSKQAGNSGHDVEIASIVEELREKKFIS